MIKNRACHLLLITAIIQVGKCKIKAILLLNTVFQRDGTAVPQNPIIDQGHSLNAVINNNTDR